MESGIHSNNMSKESLIFSLNQALRGDELPDAKVSVSHFDSATGTMYCENNEFFDQVKIKEALAYFRSAEVLLRKEKSPESHKKADHCKIAIEAINIMMSQDNAK